MIVIVIAHRGPNYYEGIVRDGTGPGSHRIAGMPTLVHNSWYDVVDRAKGWLNPKLVRRHGGVRIEIREDPEIAPGPPIPVSL